MRNFCKWSNKFCSHYLCIILRQSSQWLSEMVFSAHVCSTLPAPFWIRALTYHCCVCAWRLESVSISCQTISIRKYWLINYYPVTQMQNHPRAYSAMTCAQFVEIFSSIFIECREITTMSEALSTNMSKSIDIDLRVSINGRGWWIHECYTITLRM